MRVPFKEDLGVYLQDDLPYEFIHLRNFDEASLRLHFQKIFGLHFLEAAPTTPYLQGTPRLKLRLLPEETRKKLALMAANHPEFAPVGSALQVSEEAFQAWIYGLKDNAKALFKDIAGELIMGIELNAAFVKPYSEPESVRALRAGTNEAQESRPASQDQALATLGRDFLKVTNEAQSKANQLEKMLAHQSQTTESIKQQISVIDQTLAVLCVPLHKKIARKLRRLFLFSH